jgi:hypothetical protein
MHRLVRDALNTALQKLGFPWLTPHPTKTSREVGYFQKAITSNDLYELYKRNQMAHSIVFDVAYDALAAGFNITDLDGELNKELDQQVKKVYTERIHLPLLKTYVRARLYGSAGLLLGYSDVSGFDRAACTDLAAAYALIRLLGGKYAGLEYQEPELDFVSQQHTKAVLIQQLIGQVNEALAVLTRQTVPTLVPKASTD